MSYAMWIAPKGDNWVELHTEYPPKYKTEFRDLADDSRTYRAWSTNRIELSWDDIPPVTCTHWYLTLCPMSRRDLRGPRWRKTRRRMRRTGLRQALVTKSRTVRA